MPKQSFLFIFQITIVVFVLSACFGFAARHILTVANENRLVAELAPEIDKLPVQVEYIGDPAFTGWNARVSGIVKTFSDKELTVQGSKGEIAVVQLVSETRYVQEIEPDPSSDTMFEPKPASVSQIFQGTEIVASVNIEEDRVVAEHISIQPSKK